VSGPDPLLSLSAGLLAYGPAPGLEFIPYFLAFVGWVGLAFIAVLLSPIRALVRRLRRPRGVPPAESPSPDKATG
jgi:hypothetical protein